MQEKVETCEFAQFAGLGLNVNQQLFVIAYCRPDVGFNGTEAYLEAYAMDNETDRPAAAVSACRLLRNVNIQKAVNIEMDRIVADHKTLARSVLRSWQEAANLDVSEFLEAGTIFVSLRDIKEWPKQLRRHIQSMENTANGIKVTFVSKDKARENIAKALGMFTEIKKDVGEDYETLIERLSKEENA